MCLDPRYEYQNRQRSSLTTEERADVKQSNPDYKIWAYSVAGTFHCTSISHQILNTSQIIASAFVADIEAHTCRE
jgi:hypothetical protein